MCKIKIVVVHLTCQLIITVIIRKLNSLSLKKGFAFNRYMVAGSLKSGLSFLN
jgi:hypothetical protein